MSWVCFVCFLAGPLGGADSYLKEAEEGRVVPRAGVLIRSLTGNFWFADVFLQWGRWDHTKQGVHKLADR